jgi:hypothetical protein
MGEKVSTNRGSYRGQSREEMKRNRERLKQIKNVEEKRKENLTREVSVP